MLELGVGDVLCQWSSDNKLHPYTLFSHRLFPTKFMTVATENCWPSIGLGMEALVGGGPTTIHCVE